LPHQSCDPAVVTLTRTMIVPACALRRFDKAVEIGVKTLASVPAKWSVAIRGYVQVFEVKL
jgi:hypothetical protein